MMMEDDSGNVVNGFANRLKFEFEDGGASGNDGDEDQDWFVNDERSPSPTKSGRRESSNTGVGSTGASSPAKATRSVPTTKPFAKTMLPMKKSNSAPTVESDMGEEYAYSACKTSFLHYFPPTTGILVMEVGQTDAMTEKRYGAKYLKVYLPQVHDAQTEFCLFARKRLNKAKYRFSLNEYTMSTWGSNPFYDGKMTMTATGASRKFKLAVPKNAARVQFDIDQETRKQELVVRFNAQSKGFNLFRGRSASDNDGVSEYRSLVQKFINPIMDVRCPKSNETLLKVEKEGDVGYVKYIVTYARPFSLFVSCCVAVGIEAHLLE